MLSDNCFSFEAHPSIYECVCSVPYATPCQDNASPRPSLLAPSRQLCSFVQPDGASRPSLRSLSLTPSMRPQTYILYAVLSAALQVGSGQDLILERSTSTSPHLCLFGDDAAALLSDLPLSNGSGLNAEADEATWGGLSSRLQRMDINLI